MALARSFQNPVIQTVLQARTGTSTTLDVLEKRGLDRRDIVTALRQMERMGYGKFIIGRRGKPSRFEWLTEQRSPTPEATPTRSRNTSVRAHAVKIRPDLDIHFALPDDLTHEEAIAITKYVLGLVPD